MGVEAHAPRAFTSFRDGIGVAVEVLAERLGVRLWTATRFEGDDLLVLETHGGPPDLDAATAARWCGELCNEVAAGRQPLIITDTRAAAIERNGLRQPVEVRTHVGVPLRLSDGTLLGMLCGTDPEPSPSSLGDESATVALIGQLLATAFEVEQRATDAQRGSESLRAAALTDALTGVANRRSWDQALTREEARCARHGATASVLVVDLDNLKTVNDRAGHAAGDELLRQTAAVLQRTVRADDVVARLGGDEFGIIAVQSGREAVEALRQRLARELAEREIAASIGVAERRAEGLAAAAHAADLDMYARKHQRTHPS